MNPKNLMATAVISLHTVVRPCSMVTAISLTTRKGYHQ